MHSGIPRLLVALSFLVSTPIALAADIYRWTDESGKVHFSDVVPERFKDKAQRIDTKRSELSETQRAEAAARTQRERAARAEAATKRAAESPAPASAAPESLSASSSKPASPAATSCEALWQQYHESQECFAPYQRRERGTDPEAFKKCKVYENPSYKCGPSKR